LRKGSATSARISARGGTPYEAGLGFAVDLNKDDAFLGKDVLAEQQANGPAQRSRTLSCIVEGVDATSGPYLIHNEPIWREGHLVGHVTSGDWGFRLEAMVGLASLHQDDGVTKAWIDEGGFEVQIAGKMYPLRVQLAPYYDRTGAIMRS